MSIAVETLTKLIYHRDDPESSAPMMVSKSLLEMGDSQRREGLTRHTRLLLLALLLFAGVLPNLFLYDLASFRFDTGSCSGGISLATSAAKTNVPETPNWKYTPSELESYFLEHGATNPKLRFDQGNYTDPFKNEGFPSACELWKDPTLTTPKIFGLLQKYREELQEYEGLVANLTWRMEKDETQNTAAQGRSNSSPKDLRKYMNGIDNNKDVCDLQEISRRPQSSLQTVFGDPSVSSPQQPSRSTNNSATTTANTNMYIEPLLPPHRHPEVCFGGFLLDTGYIVHDFARMCRNSLHHNSKTVFVDMGASLSFHGGKAPPAIQLLKLYQKFGFAFDHIYGFEITPQQPSQVYQQIPDDFKYAYHWFNVGVEIDPNSYQNPFTILSQHFTTDDFVVVKLDIDTPELEIPLARQLLEGTYVDPEDGTTKRLADLVDVVYFEHHVLMKELAKPWKHSMKGSMLESLQLFAGLRGLGIAAHFWI